MTELSLGWRLARFVALCVCTVALPLGLGLAQEGGTEPNENELIEQQSSLEEQMAQKKAEIREVKKQKNSVLSELNSIDRDLWGAQNRLESLQDALAFQQEELSRARAEFERTEYEYSIAQARLESRLRNWYKSSRNPVLQMFTSAESLTDLLYRWRYAEAALSADRSSIKFIHDQRGALELGRQAINAEVERTEAIATEVEAERAKYRELREGKNKILNGIAADQRSLEAAYNEMESSSVEIEWQLARLRGEVFGDFNKTFIHPLPGRRISSGYGMRNHPILRKRKMHTGLDIPAPRGTPIRCAAPGRVVFAGWKNGYGNCVVVNHGQGYATLYGHMSKISVTTNQEVIPGTVLGGVGATGLATGNHLHFEVRIDGKPVNPSPYI